MLPIGTFGRTSFRGYITFFLLLINIMVFSVQFGVGFGGDAARIAFFEKFALSVCYVGEQPLGILLRNGLFSLFLHGSLAHLLMNMLFLWVFGPKVESYFGHRNFLIFYLISGFAAHTAHALFGGVTCSVGVPGYGGFIIGASGAISGVMGAFLLLFPATKVRTALVIPLPRGIVIPYRIMAISAKWYLLIWLGLGVLEWLVGVIFAPTSNVAHWAHIGGFVVGLILVFAATLFKPAPRVDPFEYLDSE